MTESSRADHSAAMKAVLKVLQKVVSWEHQMVVLKAARKARRMADSMVALKAVHLADSKEVLSAEHWVAKKAAH